MRWIFIFLASFIAGVIFYVFPKSEPEATYLKPNEWFYAQRAFPYEQINHKAYLDAQKQAAEMRMTYKSSALMGSWEFAGPLNVGGRLTDVEMNPLDINTIYCGAASGGVFKSSDKGSSWTAVFDEAMSLSIGDIALAPSNPDIIYVGTGEANSGGGSLPPHHLAPSLGLLVSSSMTGTPCVKRVFLFA